MLTFRKHVENITLKCKRGLSVLKAMVSKGYVETPGLWEHVPYPGGWCQCLWAELQYRYDITALSFLHLLLRGSAPGTGHADLPYQCSVPGQPPAPDVARLIVLGEVLWTVSGDAQPAFTVLRPGRGLRLMLGVSSPFPAPSPYPSLLPWDGPPSGDLHTTWGLRLLVSYHPVNETLHKDREGLYWNCSVPWWDRFKPHLTCNLERECTDGQDEAHCPYITPHCGLCRQANSSRQLLPAPPPSLPNASLSWNAARKQCVLQGGQLASLNTPREWRAVEEVLQGRRAANVFIGLHYNPYHLPSMYRSLWQWTDGSTALYVKQFHRQPRESCSFFSRQAAGLQSVACDRELNAASFLCEVSPPQAAPANVSGIAVSLPLNITRQFISSHPHRYRLCPDNHLTLAYLGSQCRERESTNHQPEDPVSSIPVSSHPKSPCPMWSYPVASDPVTSDPVFYTCLDGELHIPYSFVCDHRYHCKDMSDENFCVFPACTEIGTRHFQCKNKQKY
ncbi:hypothetical protein ACOMHN_028384 [Nucella lapillus]